MGFRPVAVSGCSGGGKASLLEELARRGFLTVPEPARRVVEAELKSGGGALPWTDMAAFARAALALARRDLARAATVGGTVFFDRGVVDAAVALAHATGKPLEALADQPPYHRLVFLTPPWPEIYVRDDARQHGLDAAVQEYERLVEAWPRLGFEVRILPRAPVAERADWLLAALGSADIATT